MGLVGLRHVGSFRTRDRTRVPCIIRWIPHHWGTREATYSYLCLVLTICHSKYFWVLSYLILIVTICGSDHYHPCLQMTNQRQDRVICNWNPGPRTWMLVKDCIRYSEKLPWLADPMGNGHRNWYLKGHQYLWQFQLRTGRPSLKFREHSGRGAP